MDEHKHGNGGTGKPRVPEETAPLDLDVAPAFSSFGSHRRVGTGEVIPMAERKPAAPLRTGDMNFTISLPELIKLGGAILLLGAMWWGLRSDLHDISVAMAYQTKTQDERYAAQVEQLKDLQRKWQLQQYDIGEIKLSLARSGIGTVEIKGDSTKP